MSTSGKAAGGPPTGTAGGDLTGTYPNPTVKAGVALTGVPTAPTAAAGDNTTQLATDAFVTTAVANAIAGVNPAVAVQAATTAVLQDSPTYANGVAGIGATLTANANNTTLVFDGYTPVAGDRLLIKNQAAALQNGVYTVTQQGGAITPWILLRALDYDMPSDINNTGAIPVVNGTVNTLTQWVITSKVTTVGTDALTFTQFSLNPTTIITSTAAPTNHGVVLGKGTQVVGASAAGTAGQAFLSGGASADPTFQTLAAPPLHLPTGALSAVADRQTANVVAGQAVLTSGTLFLCTITLVAGQVVTSISYKSAGTAVGTPVDQIFGLFDINRVNLRYTSDDGATAWAANTVKTLNLSSTYAVTTTGDYYIGIMVNATTVPNFIGIAIGTVQVTNIPPILCGNTSNTGLTNLASMPGTAGAITAGQVVPYAWVS